MRSFNQVLKLEPISVDAYIGQGNSYTESGHEAGLKLAQKDFLRAIHLNPVCTKARICLGYNLQVMHQNSLSILWLIKQNKVNIVCIYYYNANCKTIHILRHVLVCFLFLDKWIDHYVLFKFVQKLVDLLSINDIKSNLAIYLHLINEHYEPQNHRIEGVGKYLERSSGQTPQPKQVP